MFEYVWLCTNENNYCGAVFDNYRAAVVFCQRFPQFHVEQRRLWHHGWEPK